MITLDQAKNLRPGQVIYHTIHKNAKGGPERWKVNGKPRTWKRQPWRVEVPVKYGLYSYDKITENDLDLVDLG